MSRVEADFQPWFDALESSRVSQGALSAGLIGATERA